MRIEIIPGNSDETLLRRIALGFLRQLFGHRHLGTPGRKPKTVLLPLQSHRLKWDEDGKKYLPELEGEKNERQKK